MSKEYILGELEKLTSDSQYYMKNKTKKLEFVERTSELLERLKDYPLEKPERKKMLKVLDLLRKLRGLLR